MQPQIEPVTPEDFTRWRELFIGYLTFYKSKLPDQTIELTFERLFLDGEYEPCGALAWVDGRAMGLVHYLFHRHTWHEHNVCYLQDLFVDREARKSGLGRALIEFVYAKGTATEAPYTYWTTQEFNYAGRMLYDRVGTRTPFIKYQGPVNAR